MFIIREAMKETERKKEKEDTEKERKLSIYSFGIRQVGPSFNMTRSHEELQRHGSNILD